MRKLFIAVLVTGVAAAPAYAATRTVKVGDDWFVKPGNANKTVAKGTTVKFKNVGDSAHAVKVRKGPAKFSKSALLPGKTYKKTLTKTGKYKIYCDIHDGQKFTLTVK